MKISTPTYSKVLLGRQGENLATKVVLDASGLKSVPGHPVLVHQRAKDTMPYPVEITEVGDTVEWLVSSADTQYAGEGRLELRWYGDGDELIKSSVYTTVTMKALAEPGEAPEVWAGYIQQIEKKLADKMSEPENEGTPGQVLATDGNGGRYWATAQGGGATVETDTTPTEGSENPVQSGGVYDALAEKLDAKNPVASGSLSLNRKSGTTVGENSVAYGIGGEASGLSSYAEGYQSVASEIACHAEGYQSKANGYYSHAQGNKAQTQSSCAHAEGNNTIASGKSQHVQGEWNIEDPTPNKTSRGTYAHIVGNGTKTGRSNAHTLDWGGDCVVCR